MTREDFNKQINEPSKKQERIDWLTYQSEQHKKTLEHYGVPFVSYVTLNEAFKMVKEIYDDFESRTCENCKYYEPEYENEDYGVCTDNKYTKNIFTDKDFGCNKFERKTDGNV